MGNAVGDVDPRPAAVERAVDAAIEGAGKDAVAVGGDALGARTRKAQRDAVVVHTGDGVSGGGVQPHSASISGSLLRDGNLVHQYPWAFGRSAFS